MSKMIMDGCTAAAHVAYALSDVATVYPITPIASMGDTAARWRMEGRLNVMGQGMVVKEMESELGAAGAMHGALAAGALATTFTSSQGLMLMIPNMYKMAGELLPGVFHVGCRSLATHALSIFGDHQDVMACRATGVAMLASTSVQETMDLALVAHLAAIKGRVPVVHFFDGWRTSSELDTVDIIDYETIGRLVDRDAAAAFRRRGMNPSHPDLRGSAQNADVYFQNREAANPFYDAFPSLVQEAMDRVAAVTGRRYGLVEYSGAVDADRVIVIMASGAQVAAATSQWLNDNLGYKTGVVNVRLYRPFPVEQLLEVLPATVKRIAVLDRTKEPGAQHEPLCLDVIAALASSANPAQRSIEVTGGRYGLSSKEFTPAMVKGVYDMMAGDAMPAVFTVGIDDDVTHLSLPAPRELVIEPKGKLHQAIFYGIGNDGTVGGTRQVAAVMSGAAGRYAQAYFSYSAKKSGGYTISQLRVGDEPVTMAWGITQAGYVGCHKASYVRRFDLLGNIAPGGTLVINCPWSDAMLVRNIPLEMRRRMTDLGIALYTIDADSIAARNRLSPRINVPMMGVYMHLAGLLPDDEAVKAYREQVRTAYMHEGGEVVERNFAALAQAIPALHRVDYKSIAGWDDVAASPTPQPVYPASLERFMQGVHSPCFHGKGDEVPVSALSPDGTMPMGTTAWERRRIATRIPVWDAAKCVQCFECSLVCPHAAIRPFLPHVSQSPAFPATMTVADAKGLPANDLKLRIQVYPDDCLGCSSCSLICPGEALTMTPVEQVRDGELQALGWLKENVPPREQLLPAATVKGSQLQVPCLEFSGACAGCGETPYVKLLTQLFGANLLIANATGCSSIWGADFPSNPYCTKPSGEGPSWGNSLFEDNAEYGYGMLLAMTQRRERLVQGLEALLHDDATAPWLKGAIEAWLNARDDRHEVAAISQQLKEMLQQCAATDPRCAAVLSQADMLGYKSVWTIGGDGWAYDIGFAGLDHVLAQGDPVKILVMDTECYSNTGGQMSKATPRGAVAKYAPDGKRTSKKELGRMMMTYGNVYVASVALGANYQQTVNALLEAERYPGPAIVIAYCPCLNHGIRPGLGHSIVEQRRAVEAGYWPLYRYNPAASRQGRPALTIDHVVSGPDNSGHNGSQPDVTSPRFTTEEPLQCVAGFTSQEDRYADLRMRDPAAAARLQPELQADCSALLAALNSKNREPETGN